MQQNASTEYKSATNKVKQLYKAFWVTGTAFYRNVKSPVFVQSRTLHVLTYVFAKDQNHVKTSIHILSQKTFNV
jgi:hypothetical protein